MDTGINVEKIGRVIADARKKQGLTQKSLAEKLGVSDKAVSKWERGVCIPDVSCLRKLAILLDTDIESILLGKDTDGTVAWTGVLCLEPDDSEITLCTLIGDKPVCDILLSYFLLAGIRVIDLFCTSEEREYLEGRYGSGAALGLCIQYGVRAKNSSLSHCLSSLNLRDEDKLMVLYRKYFLYGSNITYSFQKAMSNNGLPTVIAVPREKGSNPDNRICFDDNRVLTDREGDSILTEYDYQRLPFIFSSFKQFREMDFSKKELMERVKGKLFIEVVNRGLIEFEMTGYEEVDDAISILSIAEKSFGSEIYDIEIIAEKRNLVSRYDSRSEE